MYSPVATAPAPPEETLLPATRGRVDPNTVTSQTKADNFKAATPSPAASATFAPHRHGERGPNQKYFTLPAGLPPNLAYFGFIIYDTTPGFPARAAHLQVGWRMRESPAWIAVISIACFLVGVLVAGFLSYAIYKRKQRHWFRLHAADFGTSYLSNSHDQYGGGALGLRLSSSESKVQQLPDDGLSGLPLDMATDDTSLLYRNPDHPRQGILGPLPRTSLSSGSSCGSASTCSTMVSLGSQWDLARSDSGSPHNYDYDSTPLKVALLHQPAANRRQEDNAGFNFQSEIT